MIDYIFVGFFTLLASAIIGYIGWNLGIKSAMRYIHTEYGDKVFMTRDAFMMLTGLTPEEYTQYADDYYAQKEEKKSTLSVVKDEEE